MKPANMKRGPLGVCLCIPSIEYVCPVCQGGGSVERATFADEECPWRDEDLPEHLRGYGYRMADQDGGSGEEWISPADDLAFRMIEQIKQDFGAEIISS